MMTTDFEECQKISVKKFIQYFYQGNLNFTLLPEDVEKMDWSWQQQFLDATVNSKLIKEYPISSKYASLFLKKIIQHLEQNQEVHDELYEHLCTSMNNIDRDGFSYRHYLIGNDINNVVTIKETKNMVVNGTTGLKTWEAALMLSDWAICNKNIFLNKNVLELGSGVGFTGITISKHCYTKSIVLTDCHNDVLKTICDNIQINFPHLQKEEDKDFTWFNDQDKSLGVLPLDWNAIDDLTEDLVPDVLIGADIVYDPSILQPLSNVIRTFCNRNGKLEVYIASVIRNEDTFNGFLKTLGEMELNYETIELPKCVHIEWNESINRSLLKINSKLK
ncbi:protein-lysine N-methyltransferase EEF2KMT [Spodoptera litura]|uniref:Protein-lysine N-methyltransferase EEF2KMT n=1 Tax=Spodoptera litura TaxID=69820 RepID=A0A9J7E159_SPOLT|nr:protein-lysine N-methyltransferase EEF2KMT [Spodoptera litura]